jgi:hypothetical protein
MLIAEDVLLLATDDATGKSGNYTVQLDPALAGAVLIELVVARRVDLQGEGKKALVVVIDKTPLGDAILDPALRDLLEKGPIKPVAAIGRLGKGLRARLYDGLHDRGILRRERAKVLGLFPTTRWPAQDSHYEDDLRGQLTDALVLGQEPTGRVAAVIAVLSAADMLGAVVDKPDLKAAKARGEKIGEGNWASDGVRKAIQDTQAAMTTAVMVSTAATIVATSG